MANTPDTKKIGLFLTIGFGVLLIILMSFAKDKLFPDTKNVVVMYFDETVKGLNVGSPVVFNGVEIGKVSKIELITDNGNNFLIPVYVRFSELDSSLSDKKFKNRYEQLNRLIALGLRARLGIQNYLTGQLYIELVLQPDSEYTLKSQNKTILEIPTVLSPIKEISKDFAKLPFRESLSSMNAVLQQLSESLPTILPQVAETFKNANIIVSRNAKTLNTTLNNINNAAVSIEKAADSLRNLTDYLERHPEAILKGKKNEK